MAKEKSNWQETLHPTFAPNKAQIYSAGCYRKCICATKYIPSVTFLYMKRISFILASCFCLAVTNAAGTFGHFSKENICIAGIATNNNRSVEGVEISSKYDDIMIITYIRDDGKIFGYACQIQGNEIKWRNQNMVGWNRNVKLYYDVEDNGKQLNVRSIVFGESINRTFSFLDFSE